LRLVGRVMAGQTRSRGLRTLQVLRRQSGPIDRFRPTLQAISERRLSDNTISRSLWTADGIALETRCWVSDDIVRGAVVIAHGFTACKDNPRVVRLASELYARRFDVIAYDARGHGHSGGSCTLGALQCRDVAVAVDLAKTLHPRVMIVGASMGAVAALSYAVEARDLAGVVAVSCPLDWRLPIRPCSLMTAWLARTKTGRAVARRFMHVRVSPWTCPESPREIVERVRCPLAVVHGQRDRIIPSTMRLGSDLEEGSPILSVLVPEMGHAFDPIGLGACWVQILDAPIDLRLLEKEAVRWHQR
jgi:pimeloyl-ACP methyl ester carboxylesterase